MTIIKGDKKAYAAILNLRMIEEFRDKLLEIEKESISNSNDLDSHLRDGISTLQLYLAWANNPKMTSKEICDFEGE